jgi:hypothetical protein
MKNITEVLREKEAQLQQVQMEVDALRVAMKLLSEDGDNHGRSLAPTGTEARVQEIKNSSSSRQFP